MANYRKLWVNWQSKTLQRGELDATIELLPSFLQYETVPFQIVFLAPSDSDPSASYDRLDISNMSLKVSLNDTLDDASPLAQQETWTKDTSTNAFQGEIVVNTAAMNTYINADNKPLYFEIEVTEGTTRSKVYRANVIIQQGVTSISSESPDPSQEYYTKQESEGRFIGSRLPAGVMITLVSPDGTRERIIGVDDDGQKLDYII